MNQPKQPLKASKEALGILYYLVGIAIKLPELVKIYLPGVF